MEGREGDNTPSSSFATAVSKNWVSWKKMEIARPPVGEKVARHGGALRSELFPLARTARHSVTCATLLFTYSSVKGMEQDSSFPVFVFLWLQSLWMDRT